MRQRSGILNTLGRLFRPPRSRTAVAGATSGARRTTSAAEPARGGETSTVEVVPPSRSRLRISYSPDADDAPDAGEIVWTWVPYDENDGRGKDRPVLVISRQDEDRVYAVRLTSRAHDGDRDFLAIGPGPWDSQGRPSWIDIEQIYSVHARGMRREASALPLDRFVRVADALHRRYGWAVGN